MKLFCQDHPEVHEIEARVLDVRGDGILVDRVPFFPGGGGQLADQGTIEWSGGRCAFQGMTADPQGTWLVLPGIGMQGGAGPTDTVRLVVSREFRGLMSELHTVAHIVNAVVFEAFGGALLTGAQLQADATLRVDFDLPGADNTRLRALDGPINDIVRQNLSVTAGDMPWDEAVAIPGMFRSKAVAPPRGDDGSVRIVEINGLDRQACGGTHLASTGLSRPVRILKVENKGRHNRRVRVGLADEPS